MEREALTRLAGTFNSTVFNGALHKPETSSDLLESLFVALRGFLRRLMA